MQVKNTHTILSANPKGTHRQKAKAEMDR